MQSFTKEQTGIKFICSPQFLYYQFVEHLRVNNPRYGSSELVMYKLLQQTRMKRQRGCMKRWALQKVLLKAVIWIQTSLLSNTNLCHHQINLTLLKLWECLCEVKINLMLQCMTKLTTMLTKSTSLKLASNTLLISVFTSDTELWLLPSAILLVHMLRKMEKTLRIKKSKLDILWLSKNRHSSDSMSSMILKSTS